MPISIEPLNVLDILRSIPDSVLTIDAEQRLIALNAPAETLTGHTETAAVGRSCGQILQSEICATARCPFERSFRGGETVTTFNVLAKDASGTDTPICINTSPLKNAKGDVVGVVETIRVVTHINRLIDELREQRNKVQAVLDSIAEGVFTVDRDGGITSLNRTAERVLDRRAGTVLGQPCADLLPAEICGAASPLQETLRTGRVVRNRELAIVGPNGRAIPLSVCTGPFRDEAGSTLGAVCTFRDLREIEQIVDERRRRTPFRQIIGAHPRMREIFDLVEMIKDSDSTVLLQGESGTGKGLFAHALHYLSPRERHPFVKVSCAALPETLLESELFGHEKGAFTGAIKERKGRFELADKGTIFLDEIGDLSPTVQVKLLRVLQEQQFERLGGNETIQVDVRVIAATHRDLPQLMRERRFREDLYYRLNVIPIHIPALRERKADIPALVESLLDRFATKGKGRALAVSPHTMSVLLDHDWPGNIRELENALEHAMVCSRGGMIEPDALPRSILTSSKSDPQRPDPSRTPVPAADEKAHLLRALETTRWNRGLAAARLGMDRTTLWRKMRRWGIVVPSSPVGS